MKQHFFSNENLKLSYIDSAPDDNHSPVVILLHGFTNTAKGNWVDTNWFSVLPKLGLRLIALDARGHGQSDKPYDANQYPASVMANDGIVLMDQLSIKKAHFVGYSMGARMSVFVASQHSHRVLSLIIGGFGDRLLIGQDNTHIIVDALLAPSLKDVKDREARRFRRLAERQHNDLKALAACIGSSRQKITAEQLQKIKIPCRIIVGKEDTIAGDPEKLANHLSHSDYKIIENVNHFTCVNSKAFIDYGYDFLATLTKKT